MESKQQLSCDPQTLDQDQERKELDYGMTPGGEEEDQELKIEDIEYKMSMCKEHKHFPLTYIKPQGDGLMYCHMCIRNPNDPDCEPLLDFCQAKLKAWFQLRKDHQEAAEKQ